MKGFNRFREEIGASMTRSIQIWETVATRLEYLDPAEGQQNVPPQDMPLWGKFYFELDTWKAADTKWTSSLYKERSSLSSEMESKSQENLYKKTLLE